MPLHTNNFHSYIECHYTQ